MCFLGYFDVGTITALRAGKRKEGQVNLFLDGKFAFSIGDDRVANEGLKVGLEISGNRLQTLLDSLKEARCLDAAYRYLSYRSRSEAELIDRLRRRGFPATHIAAALSKLKEQGLIDDSDFARFWVENRTTFNPRSRSMARNELRRKGVPADAINGAVAEIDEAESAYRAAQRKIRQLSGLDLPEFRRRLGEFLRRRGFNYDTISRTVQRVWLELKENP